ncbi:MAG: dual specificity protein phosphatase family protein [Planctomycetes bacterium]|nr:dual specificity protein phosphatase family protein [Planctomycetota bacterium]
MFTRKKLWKWGLVLALAATASAWLYTHHKRYKHFAVHDPQMVYRSAWLEADVFRELIEDHQIRTVLNLCEPNELGADRCVAQRQAVRGSGARLIEMPMPAAKLDPADPEIAKFVEVLSNPENYPMLVHCQHGVTRTAKVLVMYDILYRHMTAEQSIAAMPLFRHNDYPVSVRAFARNFEEQYQQLYPQAAGKLDILRR